MTPETMDWFWKGFLIPGGLILTADKLNDPGRPWDIYLRGRKVFLDFTAL
jgi:hypothetical protein